MRRERKKIIGMVGLMVLLCFMTAGYAAFGTNLSINGTASITGTWDVQITGVSVNSVQGGAENVSTPTWDSLTANVEANLYEKGDAVIYDVVIKNNGNIDAVLEDVSYSAKSENGAIKISVLDHDKNFTGGSSKTIQIKIEYNSDYTGELDYSKAAETEITLGFIQATTANSNN